MSNIIETTISRIDPLTRKPAATIFHLGKIQYTFVPRPELTGDEETSVCIVISQEHRDYLLNDPMCRNHYREYVPRVKVVGAEEALDRAMFEEWKKLRETLSQEEIMAMMTPKPAAQPENKEPETPVVTATPNANAQNSGSTAITGNTGSVSKKKTETTAAKTEDISRGGIF